MVVGCVLLLSNCDNLPELQVYTHPLPLNDLIHEIPVSTIAGVYQLYHGSYKAGLAKITDGGLISSPRLTLMTDDSSLQLEVLKSVKINRLFTVYVNGPKRLFAELKVRFGLLVERYMLTEIIMTDAGLVVVPLKVSSEFFDRNVYFRRYRLEALFRKPLVLFEIDNSYPMNILQNLEPAGLSYLQVPFSNVRLDPISGAVSNKLSDLRAEQRLPSYKATCDKILENFGSRENLNPPRAVSESTF